MTSKSIIKSVAQATGKTQVETKKTMDAIEVAVKEILGAMSTEEKFKVMDLTFSKKDVPAGERRNPSTGETFMAEATKKLAVKPSADMKKVAKA